MADLAYDLICDNRLTILDNISMIISSIVTTDLSLDLNKVFELSIAQHFPFLILIKNTMILHI